MSIAPGNHIAHTQKAGITNQGVTPYSSHNQVSKEDQEDFESKLDLTHWNKDNEKIFNKGFSDYEFREANASSRHYVEEHKKIMDDLTDSGKSKSRHRQG
ncbi:MAG: hypothetical protein ACOYK6_00030 [Chthoniobacterales bacterium]